MNAIVARMLGEAAPAAPPEDIDDPENPAGDSGGGKSTSHKYTNPTVEQLIAAWESGSHESVAIRVLDALDSYEDFVELLFRIGHEGAQMLGMIMDEMTADQKSDHAYDDTADLDLGRGSRHSSAQQMLPKPPHRHERHHESRRIGESPEGTNDGNPGDKDAEEEGDWNFGRRKKKKKKNSK